MKKSMHERYENAAPIGVYAICNLGGIEIFEPDEVDHCKDNCDLIAAWNEGGHCSGFHKHMIHYTESGRSYIRKGGLRIYLDEVVRVS